MRWGLKWGPYRKRYQRASLLPPCEDTARRQLSAAQGEGARQKLAVPAPWSGAFYSLQKYEKINFCCLSHSAYGILLWQLKHTQTLVNVLGCVGHIAFVTAIRFSRCALKAAVDRMWTREWDSPKTILSMDTYVWNSYSFHGSWYVFFNFLFLFNYFQM